MAWLAWPGKASMCSTMDLRTIIQVFDWIPQPLDRKKESSNRKLVDFACNPKSWFIINRGFV